ncbi:terpene synthase 5-like isoform X2 [Euphorbia lathyris]|uniref:terpene synthase 5-like isoform X2 n=1 Tax=Euphorbia lathyris TaxID=212925 RepID=UPI00331356CE
MAVPMAIKPEEDIFRGCLKNRPLSNWGQTFASLAPHDSELESHNEQVEAMKVKVKNMLIQSAENLTDNIQFINLLCRLGVSYHFEDVINEHLNSIFTMLPKLLEHNDYDLCTLANLFRVLRQYGYKMTCDVFKKFKDEDGEFRKDIANDVKSILCLYEACFLAIPGEDILDGALAFTRKRLEILAESSSPHLQKHISNSLMYPSHHIIERLDTFNYICFYEEDEYADEILLKFAKLDYNGLQLLYRKELALLSKWWKDLNVVENLPYARDRLVEAYMWALGFVFEPQCSISRMLICKFTTNAGDELSEYMKFLYRLVFELIENDGPQGCSYKITYVREMVKELLLGYNVEAIWLREKKAPSFDQYVKNGKVTSVYDCLISVFILGVENIGMKEILWIRNDPEIVVGAKLHPRLLNDICAVRTDETNRGDFPKGVDCYTIQHDVSENEAIEAIQKMLQNKWKGMNEDLLKPNTLPRILLKCTLNYARLGIFFYQDNDYFTYGQNMKQHIRSLLINPFPM